MKKTSDIPDPENRDLAQKIGDQLERGKPLSELEEPRLKNLLAMRENTSGISPIQRERLWKSISSEIENKQQSLPVNGQNSLQSIRKWAIAAIILIISMGTLVTLQYFRSDSPSLIASSYSDIEFVSLDDGSTVTLRPNSNLYLLSEEAETVRYRLEGEAFFDIRNLPERTFAVEAGNGLVEVLGTQFNIREWGGQTEVFLKEGSVQLSDIEKRELLTLVAGQRAVISADMDLSEPISANSDEVTAWMEHQLLFQNRTTDEIFRELEHHFQIRITAPDTILQERLGGSVSLEELHTSLQDLGIVLGGRFDALNQNRYEFVPIE
ncbi:MAG: FecR domain-containing protein [Balneolaceae bacterium]